MNVRTSLKTAALAALVCGSLASAGQAVTSYTYTQNCRYLGGYQRVDIKVVQDWLATFGVYPATA